MSGEEGTLDLAKWEELHEEGITILGASNVGMMVKNVKVESDEEDSDVEIMEEQDASIKEVPSSSMMKDFDPTHPDNEQYKGYQVPAWADVIDHAQGLEVQLAVIEKALTPADMSVLRRIRQMKNLVSKLQGDIARMDKEDKNQVLQCIFDDEI